MKMGSASLTDLAARIASFLRQRGEAASSHLLAARFLKTAVGSEELATRLLRPLLASYGIEYVEGIGWMSPGFRQRSVRCVTVAGEWSSGHLAMVEISDMQAGGPLDPGAVSLEDATAVVLERRRDAPALRAWLRRRGQPLPAAIISLRSAVRGAARIPRAAGLADLCAALGVRWLDSEDAAGTARAMASCILAAGALRSPPEPEETPGETPLPVGVAPQDLAELPEAPGVYRFYDADGSLVYVGKAADLKRRVSSYFTPAAARRPRRFYSAIHSLEYDVVGSELEALLSEARLIRRRSPGGNVQVQVHERGIQYGGARSWALLLPRVGGRGATAILTRDGRYMGHVRIGPRGGGLPSATRLLRRLVGRGPAERDTAVTPRRSRPKCLRASAPADRDSEILSSWLAKHGDRISRLDLDSFPTASDAARALARAVRLLPAEPEAAIFR